MKKLLLMIVAVLLLTVSVFAFSDVPETHWAYDAVHTVSEQGLVKGYPDGTFQPSGTLTRAEFLTMCVRTKLGEQTAESGEVWWKPYYDAAVSAKWALPFTEETITGSIPRFEISSLLRAAGAEANQYGKNPAKAGEFAFTDDKAMQETFAVFDQTAYNCYMDTQWAVKRGLITGYPDGSFRHSGALTRAEAATVLYRLTVQNEIAEKNGEIIVQTDDFVIYNIPTEAQTDIVSLKLPEKTELGRCTAARANTGVENFADWLKVNSSEDVLNANGKYFWGISGFYEYFEDGTFKQLTDVPVIDYGYDVADGSFVFVSHPKDAPQRLYTSGISYPVGTMVLRLTAEGQLLTLADQEDFKDNTALPDGTPWLSPVRVHYATGGKVQVEGQYNWGMGDLRKVIIEVANDTVSLVQMGAGNGYSY